MNELKKSFTCGGGETLELTCLEAADRFVKKVLSKNLKSENVRFPEHIFRRGTNPEGPKLLKQELEERGNQITEPGEKILYNTHLTALKGAECERAVWDYIISSPSNIRCATFMSYDNKMFLRFTGTPDTSETKGNNAKTNEAPVTQKAMKEEAPDAIKEEAPGAEKEEAPDAIKEEAPDAVKEGTPDAVKEGASNAVKAGAPDAMKEGAPDAVKVGTPDAMKEGAPGSVEEGAPDAVKEGAPDDLKEGAPGAEKEGAPDAVKEGAPGAVKEGAPGAVKEGASGAVKEGAPDAVKEGDPDAEKYKAFDIGTTASKSTQTQDQDFKKVPKIKANKSANTQAHVANKPSKAKANKSIKNQDQRGLKFPEGNSEKSTQTKNGRGKANKAKGPANTDNQEFDFVFLLGEYKTFVIFEVKAQASFNHGKGKWEEQLEKGEHFFKTIIKYIGDEDYKNWTYLPIAAFPKATDIKKVIFFLVIIKMIILNSYNCSYFYLLLLLNYCYHY